MQFLAAGQYVFESQPVGRGMARLAAEFESQSQIPASASIKNTARSCSSPSLPQTRKSEHGWVCGYRGRLSNDIEDIFDSNPGPALGTPERPSRFFCPVIRFHPRLSREAFS